MRERLDEHSRFLESQLAGLECLVLDKGNPTFPMAPAAFVKPITMTAALSKPVPAIPISKEALPATVSIQTSVVKPTTPAPVPVTVPAPDVRLVVKSKPAPPIATVPVPAATQAYVPMVPAGSVTTSEPAASHDENTASPSPINRVE